MDTASFLKQNQKVLWYAGGTILSALLFYLSTGLTGFPILLWIAPIPVLLVAYYAPWRIAIPAAFIAYLIGGLNLFSFLSKVAPFPIVILAITGPAVIFMLCVLASKLAMTRLKDGAAMLAFPILWTASEYFDLSYSPHGTYGNLAYTQADLSIIIQLVSLTGILGVSFLLTLVPASIAAAIYLRNNRKEATIALLIGIIPLLATIGWSLYKLAEPVSKESITVGLVCSDKTVKYFKTTQSSEALPVVQEYVKRIETAATKGASIVLLPEKFVGVAPEYADEVYKIFNEAALKNKVTIIAGFNFTGSGKQRNLAAIFSPAGQLLGEYDKYHLLPAFESQYQPGSKKVIFTTSNNTSSAITDAGVAICKDMDFISPASDYGKSNVGIMFVPAWDFVVDGHQHSRMAIVRGIENGYAVVRNAQEGLLTISDHHGTILGEMKSSTQPEAILINKVPVGYNNTFYKNTGDWFAWVDLLLFILLAFMVITRPADKRKRF